jgi:hypothetical protein
MIRKTLYALLGITLVLVVNQIVVTPSEGSIVPGGTTATATTTTTTSGLRAMLEVRLSATGSAAGIDSLAVTVSSVEIHLPGGWSKMAPAGSDRAELVALTGSEQTLATAELNQGTYTQIRLTFSRADAY